MPDERLAARQRPDGRRASRLIDGWQALGRLVRVQDADATRRLDRLQERNLARRRLDGRLERRHPEAEPLVDRGLRRAEDRDRLAALLGLVEQADHHRAQDAAPCVGGQHADERDPRRADLAARDGQPKGVGAGHADRRLAFERAEHPVDLGEMALHLELLGHEVVAERDRQRLE